MTLTLFDSATLSPYLGDGNIYKKYFWMHIKKFISAQEIKNIQGKNCNKTSKILILKSWSFRRMA